MRPAIAIGTSATHFENILASYLDESKELQLSDKEKSLKNRWEAAFALLLNYRSREQARKVLEEQFNISTPTAYRDINAALSLFGDINKSRKEGFRYIIFEYNQNLFQMATKVKDLDAMGRCLDRMIKLADLDKDELPFNPEKVAAMRIEVNLSPETQKVVNTMLSKGVVDLNSLQAQDIPHEEVDE